MSKYLARFAENPAEVRAALRLRYDVFVTELGGDGPNVDHKNRLETDVYDAFCDHLLLFHSDDDAQVVGVYRLMTSVQAQKAGGFYTAQEFDLTPLHSQNRSLLEVGRSCLHPDHRGGAAMLVIWNALTQHVFAQGYNVVFGVASFHGTDPKKLAGPLSFLNQNHLIDADIRPVALPKSAVDLSEVPETAMPRKDIVRQLPPLIKAYLRLGGGVGQGAFVDKSFNTIDVCLVLEPAKMSPLQKGIYLKGLNR